MILIHSMWFNCYLSEYEWNLWHNHLLLIFCLSRLFFIAQTVFMCHSSPPPPVLTMFLDDVQLNHKAFHWNKFICSKKIFGSRYSCARSKQFVSIKQEPRFREMFTWFSFLEARIPRISTCSNMTARTKYMACGQGFSFLFDFMRWPHSEWQDKKY